MILGLLFHFKPFTCPGCSEVSEKIICDSCLSSMRKNHGMLRPQDDSLRGIFPIFISYSTTHKILAYWKDHGGEELKKILFSPSADLKTELQKRCFDLIIPIPQHLNRSLKRGHASAFEVAKFFSKELNILLDQSLKLREVSGKKQADLHEWERRYGENPFIFVPPIPSPLPAPEVKKILLVDDFITTGSTLEKAVNAIHATYPNSAVYAASLGWRPKKSFKI